VDDSWQFSRNNEDSGIHETSKDYILMGTKITGYELAQKNPTLSAIRAIVDPKGTNESVFNAIGQWFVNNEAALPTSINLQRTSASFLSRFAKMHQQLPKAWAVLDIQSVPTPCRLR
jgi:hypothetical protein